MASVARSFSIRAGQEDAGTRVDRFISSRCPQFPRSAAADGGTVFQINGHIAKKSKKVQDGDLVAVRWTEFTLDQVCAQDIPLQIVYEDRSILVIDKQQGLVVHPGAGNPDGTLANALVHRYGEGFFALQDSEDDGPEDVAPEEDALRPGIVHRLDKDTSGIMVVALTRESHLALASQFKERSTEKHYVAIVCGRMPKRRGRMETTIVRDRADRKRFAVGSVGEGKTAVTEYLVLRQFANHALVRLRLLTGRTHQIRVHMRSLGCPILGDPIYGKRDSLFPDATLMLHAFTLDLQHPETKARMRFRAPLPVRFKQVVRELLALK